MAQQHIDFGTPPTGADGDTVTAALQKMEGNFTELYDAFGDTQADQAFISGFKLKYVSPTSVQVSKGIAYSQGDGKRVSLAADLTLTGLSLTTSTMYHLYLDYNGGAPTVRCLSTALASPYFGAARTASGDTSKRYLGSIRTASDGSIFPFSHHGDVMWYQSAVSSSPFRVLSAGSATSETTVSMASVVPASSRIAIVRIVNNMPSSVGTFGTPDDSVTLSDTSFLMRVPAGSEGYPDLALGPSQDFTYLVQSTASGGIYVDVRGYRFLR